MPDPANLDIISVLSFGLGDITDLVRAAYLDFIQNNPKDVSNTWKIQVPPVHGQGIVSWRVRYPFGAGYSNSDFGTSEVQTQICSFDKASATIINYDPLAVKSFPQKSDQQFFVSALWWGTTNITPTSGNLHSWIKDGRFQATVDGLIGNQSKPSAPSSNYIYMTYGYVVQQPQLPPNLLLGSYITHYQNSIDIPVTPPSLLRVLGACYGDTDVSDIVRSRIDFRQVLSLDLAKRDRQLLRKEDTVGPASKTLSILWQYEDGDIQCWASNSATGMLTIRHDDQPKPVTPLCRRPRAGEHNVVAIVWGDGTKTLPNQSLPLAELFNEKVFGPKRPEPSPAWFDNLDPNPGLRKSCHIYYRYGLTGDVVVAAVYENTSIEIRPQSTDFIDPQPARGLLRPDSPVPCFTLTINGRILTLARSGDQYDSFRLKSVASGTTGAMPAHFMVVRTNTLTPFALLSVYIPDVQAYGYLGLPPNQQWTGGKSVPLTFLVPNTRGVPAVQDFALAFNYEVSSRSNKEGLIFAFSKYTTSSPYHSGVSVMLETSDGSIELVPAQQGLNQLPAVCFQPEFSQDPHPMNVHAMMTDPFEEVDSCLMQTLAVIKIFMWDLPVLLLGFTGFSTSAKKAYEALAKWWSKVSKVGKAAILFAAKNIQHQLHVALEGGQELSGVGYFKQFVEIAVEIYDAEAMWSLFKSLMGGWNWWTVGKVLLNLIAFAVEFINPAAFAAKVIKYGILIPKWAVESAVTFGGWIRDCLLSWGQRAVALSTLIDKSAKSVRLLTLPPHQQMAVLRALSVPILHKIIEDAPATNSTTLEPSINIVNDTTHALIVFHDTSRSLAGLSAEHLNNPWKHTFSALSAEALEIARELAPEFHSLQVS